MQGDPNISEAENMSKIQYLL